jgi:hypothetical protein
MRRRLAGYDRFGTPLPVEFSLGASARQEEPALLVNRPVSWMPGTGQPRLVAGIEGGLAKRQIDSTYAFTA